MSNYIVVSNGLLKSEKPKSKPVVIFGGFEYKDTVVNGFLKGKLKEIIESDESLPYTEGITREHIREAIEYVYRNNPSPLSPLLRDEAPPGLTGRTFEIVMPRYEENPLSRLNLQTPIIYGTGGDFTATIPVSLDYNGSIDYLTPSELHQRGVITDIEYLDLISNIEENV